MKKILIFLALLFSTSCANSHQLNKELRLGFLLNVTHAPALVGVEKNIFQETLGKDVVVKPIHFVVGNSIVDAFITNQLDIAYIGPGPFINALYRDIPIKLLSNVCNAGTLIVGNKTTNKEKSRIAVPQFGNTQDLLLRIYLQKNNLNKVHIFAIPSQDIGTAFFTMSIDAACVPEPWGSILIDKSKCNVLVDENNLFNNGNYPVTVLIVSEKYFKSHPQIINKFITANNKAINYINNNIEESSKVCADFIAKTSKKKIKPESILKSLQRCRFTEVLEYKSLEAFAQAGIDAGYYKKGFLEKVKKTNEGIIN